MNIPSLGCLVELLWRNLGRDLHSSHYGQARAIASNHTLLAALLILGLSAGCQAATPYPARQVTFESLCGLTETQFAAMHEADARDWLQRQYSHVPNRYEEDQGVISLRVPQSGNEGVAAVVAFLRQDYLFNVLRSAEGGPVFGQVVAAFGEPISAYGGVRLGGSPDYTVGLDYPKLGISVFANKNFNLFDRPHDGRFQIQMVQEFAVDLVDCYTPASSMEDVIRERFPSDSVSIEYELGRRKPWVGFGAWIPLAP